MSRASWNVLAQIPAYTANAHNEQRRSKTESCELSRLGSSEATERLGLQRCASSDERKHGKFTVVLARAVNFIWVLEERRDNAIMNNEGKGESMVQINGEQVEASKVVGKTLLAYVTEAGYDPVGIVIEKNMEIIHREDFDKVNIADEDVIEILHFVGGGQL